MLLVHTYVATLTWLLVSQCAASLVPRPIRKTATLFSNFSNGPGYEASLLLAQAHPTMINHHSSFILAPSTLGTRLHSLLATSSSMGN